MSNRKKLYQATDAHIAEAFADKPVTVRHLRRTADYVEQLRPDADEAFLIAAVAHDLERSERDPSIKAIPKNNSDFLKHHQERSAEMTAEFLREQSADEDFIERVVHLIKKHEVGGDTDQDLLMDVDSVSFFENNIDHFLSTKLKQTSIDDIREKLDWMFDRIKSTEAKDLASPYYKDAMKRLEEIKK